MGSDSGSGETYKGSKNFNPRSPRGERRLFPIACKDARDISIHAPRVGSDLVRNQALNLDGISIHAPRVGSDGGNPRRQEGGHDFNPRSPRGERPKSPLIYFVAPLFQSTLPAWGATPFRSSPTRGSAYFNPRSPRGERLNP